MERTLKQFDTEDLLRELSLREGVVIAAWTVEDLADEVEYRAGRMGYTIHGESALAEMSAKCLKSLGNRLESSMIECSYDIVGDAADEVAEGLIESGWATQEEA